jgi:uncharacterized protein (DUF885 family)
MQRRSRSLLNGARDLMNFRFRIAGLLSALALALGGCASTRIAKPPSAALSRLLADSDEAQLARNPGSAIYRGDMRYAAQFGDYASDAYIAAERAAADDDLARLAAIDRAALAPAERLAYDTFQWQRSNDRRNLAPEFISFGYRLAPDHFNGAHLYFPDLSSGDGVAPYATAQDHADGLARIDGFIVWLGRARTRLAEGAALGIVHPRFVVERLIAQFNTLARQGPDDSPFLGPLRKLPAGFTDAERRATAQAYTAMWRERLAPALAAMRDFLRDDYLPHARSSVGLSALPGGAAWYRQQVAENTGTALMPEAIHRLGLAEVARIAGEMEAVRAEVGFARDLPAFLEYVRKDARFRPRSAEALKDGYTAIGAQVDTAVARLFAHRPRAPLEIRPTPAHRERTDAVGSYQNGTPDGSQPGVFFYNTHDLASRNVTGMETLYLHEAVPGHHFQIGLAQENEALPKLLRFGFNTAFAEGWALYAETLGPELGMYRDPYSRFGHLDAEMLRAMRLVVDTGLHAQGWTREQAIDYMLANSAMGQSEATAEVERYAASPAQALAYKIGQLTIRRLRTQAEAALGPRFDIRAFHDQVLNTGSLPLAVLEAKIAGWIAAGGPP